MQRVRHIVKIKKIKMCVNSTVVTVVLKFFPSLEFFFCFFFFGGKSVKVRGVLIPHVPEIKLTKSSASICLSYVSLSFIQVSGT